jgi:hypothetical protein
MPGNPLGKRLDALGKCWLEVHCSCQIVYMPLPLMAKKHGGALLLGDLLPRLRCSKCGGRAKFMALVERPEPSRAAAPTLGGSS